MGPALGLTPSRYQSGETDRPGAVTKASDARARVPLFEAAHVMMTRVVRWFPLKAWAMRVAAPTSRRNRHDAGYACNPFPLREGPGEDDGRGQAAGHFGTTRMPSSRWAPSANADRIR